MSIFWLEWREPRKNLCIHVGLIDGGGGRVIAPYCVAVDIVVADADRLYVCSLGHDALRKH